ERELVLQRRYLKLAQAVYHQNERFAVNHQRLADRIFKFCTAGLKSVNKFFDRGRICLIDVITRLRHKYSSTAASQYTTIIVHKFLIYMTVKSLSVSEEDDDTFLGKARRIGWTMRM